MQPELSLLLTANGDLKNITTTTPITNLGVSADLYWAGQIASSYPSNPNFALLAGDLNTGASYSDTKLSGGFFTTTGTFRGAFGSTDWTDGWSEFQPVNKVY
jgi:hypothetical protein